LSGSGSNVRPSLFVLSVAYREWRSHHWLLDPTPHPSVLLQMSRHIECSVITISSAQMLPNWMTHLGVRLDLKPARTQVTFTSKCEDWRRVVVSNLPLLRIISNTHPNMVLASATEAKSKLIICVCRKALRLDIPPYVEGHLEAHNQYALVDLTSTVSERMLACSMFRPCSSTWSKQHDVP
jgi:hypothetical protein